MLRRQHAAQVPHGAAHGGDEAEGAARISTAAAASSVGYVVACGGGLRHRRVALVPQLRLELAELAARGNEGGQRGRGDKGEARQAQLAQVRGVARQAQHAGVRDGAAAAQVEAAQVGAYAKEASRAQCRVRHLQTAHQLQAHEGGTVRADGGAHGVVHAGGAVLHVQVHQVAHERCHGHQQVGGELAAAAQAQGGELRAVRQHNVQALRREAGATGEVQPRDAGGIGERQAGAQQVGQRRQRRRHGGGGVMRRRCRCRRSCRG